MVNEDISNLRKELDKSKKKFEAEEKLIEEKYKRRMKDEKAYFDERLTGTLRRLPLNSSPDEIKECNNQLGKEYIQNCNLIYANRIEESDMSNRDYLKTQALIYNRLGLATNNSSYFIEAVNRFEQVAELESNNPSKAGYVSDSKMLIRQMHEDAKDARKHYKEITGEELPRHHHKGKGLEGILAVLGILGGIILLPTNITGNVISDLTPQGTSFLGIGLICAGLIAAIFWFKGRKE